MLREHVKPITTEMMDIRVGALGRDRHLYQHYPPYQRDQVWNLQDKQWLILAILHNYPMQSLMFMKDMGEFGQRIFQVVDGQQRMETLLSFLDNGFETMNEKQANSAMMDFEVIEPGKTYGKLSPEMRNRIDDYLLHVITFDKQDEDELEKIYLLTNRHKQLTVGERIFIHNGRARQLAMRLLKHPLWDNLYGGGTRRKEPFQAAITTLCLEVYSYPLNLRIHHASSNPIIKIISGEEDSQLTETLFNIVWNRYTAINHLFNGVYLMSKADMIPVYEAALYLDEQGFDLLSSDKGALDTWFSRTKQGMLLDRLEHKPNFGRMDFLSEQKDFWHMYAETLTQVEGLVKR